MRTHRPSLSSALALTAALALAACGGSQAGDGATTPAPQTERATEQATGGAMSDQSAQPSGAMTDDGHDDHDDADDHDHSHEPGEDHTHDHDGGSHDHSDDHSDDHDHSHEPGEDHTHD
ncbi:hypothetical protein J5X07_06145 [Actinomyces bowdenii]|uniref:hypothetical protein n=1 Tax=Actinomyces bowdenii TaxID=131109 RepID=UPI00163B5B96|nr:hypothetical protein [Actinomyces bowdenii]MBO3724614.1 hypothetical protein [Actinomyces bowdenii]